ncbi:MAG: YceD family protein [Succinivibrio dextrinosolvens]|nr:YceD family protein [Succinivibrio dextrinosolvens]
MADLAFNEIVNFEKLVSNCAEYKTTIDPSYLPRLAEACSSVLQPVKVEFRFYEDLQGLRTIEGSFSAKVRFVCQRCRKEFDKEITGHFQSTCDEEKARSLKLEEKLDIVELNEDGSFNLLSFLEDCILLEIPYITSHDEDDPECVSSEDSWTFGELAEEAQQNPFSALAELKDKFKK